MPKDTPSNVPSPRTARSLAEFVKFRAVGTCVFGYVSRAGKNANGDFVVLEPAAVRFSARERFEKYGELAVGLSTDLASKLSPSDVGQYIFIAFVGTRPTSKDPMKLYNVVPVTRDNCVALLNGESEVPGEWLAAPVDVDGQSTRPAHERF